MTTNDVMAISERPEIIAAREELQAAMRVMQAASEKFDLVLASAVAELTATVPPTASEQE